MVIVVITKISPEVEDLFMLKRMSKVEDALTKLIIMEDGESG